MIRNQVAGFLLVLGCLAACVDINGGAVELRWEIRKTDGRKSDCSETQVSQVRLCATPVGSTGSAVCDEWTCSDYQGSTGFDIAPGRYALAITPVCSDGSKPSASVPEPVVRDISNGNVAELNTLLIVKIGDTFICK